MLLKSQAYTIKNMENQNIGSPEELLSAITQVASQGAPSTPEVPSELIGDIPREQFLNALTTITGGAIKDPAEITQLLGTRQKLTEYERQVQEFQAKAAVSPFADSLVEKLNELALKGASKAELQRFLQYQDIEPQSMDDVTAYRKMLEFQHPTLTQAEITALIDDKFDPDKVTAGDPSVTGRLKMESAQARTFLNDLKVQSQTPESVQSRQQQQQQQQRFQDGWKQVIDKAAPTIKASFSKQFDGVSAPYQFSHQFSPEALELAKQDAMAWAVANRIPFNQDGLAQVQRVMEQQAAAYDRENMVTALADDLWKSAVMVMLKKTAGAPPPSLPATSPPASGQAQKPTRPDPLSLV